MWLNLLRISTILFNNSVSDLPWSSVRHSGESRNLETTAGNLQDSGFRGNDARLGLWPRTAKQARVPLGEGYFGNAVDMKRFLDFSLALIALGFLALPVIVVAILVRLTSSGPALYWSDRVGRDNRIFKMPKFRSMRVDTPDVATHLLSNAGSYLTPIGSFLRMTSLDELPQLWSILAGDMSFVGPRPALYNQHDLVELRTKHGVHKLLPGLTGWAQINGRDELPIPEKVALDVEYMKRCSFWFDCLIICKTAIKVVRRDGIKH